MRKTISVAMLIAVGALCTRIARPNTAAADTPPLGPAHTGFLDNGHIRLGVNLDLGGAITYLSKSGTDVNLINSFDWGRQIQMSHYSGPVPFAPNGKQPKPEWAGLGWNPIQSGDAFGNRSHILAYRNDGREIYVKSVPMQWPLNNEPGECTFECWIRLEGETAQVRSRMVNNRVDKTQYGARDQELPAVYTNGPWYRLMTYRGDKPFTGDAISQIPSQFPWAGWQATENWAALVNEAGWGLGIWEPGATTFIGGFAGKTGSGGPKDGPTGYIAPLQVEILDPNITYEYRYVLILGALDAIRSYVVAHSPTRRPPAYHFNKDRQHWHFENAADTGWPVVGELNITPHGENPQLIGPTDIWKAHTAPRLTIQAAFATDQSHAKLFWKRFDAREFAESRRITFATVPDGKYHTYVVDLSASPEYQGAITGIRLDPAMSGKPGEKIRVKSIAFE